MTVNKKKKICGGIKLNSKLMVLSIMLVFVVSVFSQHDSFNNDFGEDIKDNLFEDFPVPQDEFEPPMPPYPGNPENFEKPGDFDGRGFEMPVRAIRSQFYIPPRMPEIPAEEVLSAKMGEIVFERFSFEELESQCPDVEAIVDKVYSYLSKTKEFSGMCSEIEQEAKKCGEAKEFCETISEPERENEGFQFGCPFNKEEFKGFCLEDAKERISDEIEFQTEQLRDRCEFEWDNISMECERAQDMRKEFEEEQKRRIEEEKRFREEERKRREEERRRFEEERKRHEEEIKQQEEKKREFENNRCPEIFISPEFRKECESKGGIIREKFDNGCLVEFYCENQQTGQPEEQEPIKEQVEENEESTVQEPQPEEEQQEIVEETSQEQQQTTEEQPTDANTQNAENITASSPFSVFTNLITGFQSLFGIEKEFDESFRPPQRAHPQRQPEFGPPKEMCQKENFFQKCLEKGKKEIKYRLNLEREEKRCEFEARRMKREADRMCKQIEKGKKECIENAERHCSFLEKQAKECKTFASKENIKKIIRREATKMCKMVFFKKNKDRYKKQVNLFSNLENYAEELPEDFKPIIRAETLNIIEAEQEKEEIKKMEQEKGIIYQLTKLLGQQQKRELEEAKKLEKQAEKIKRTISTLETISEQIGDTTLKESLQTQIEELKGELSEIEKSVKNKKQGAAGIFGFISGLFGG